MGYISFLEEKVDPKQLLWNHYINCCNTLGLKIDTSFEDYFNNMDDEQINKYINFLNLDLH